MSGSLIVVLPALKDDQRAVLSAAAAAHGFQSLFFEEEQSALPFLDRAEILFAHSPLLASRAPALRWLCTPFAGADAFMKPGLFAMPDVLVSNSSGAYGVAIAEHILMVTLELLRRQQEINETLLHRQWVRTLPVRSILGSRVTLLGTGDIGQETAIRLRAFRPQCILGVNRTGAAAPDLFGDVFPRQRLDSVLPDTDILVLSLPATPETKGIMNADRLALLPDGALIVNVGRGSALDQRALLLHLQSGRLCAALDVFDREPLPPDDPLWTAPNVLLTPHIAGTFSLPYTVQRIVDLFLEDFENYCAGRPLLRRVDLALGY